MTNTLGLSQGLCVFLSYSGVHEPAETSTLLFLAAHFRILIHLYVAGEPTQPGNKTETQDDFN